MSPPTLTAALLAAALGATPPPATPIRQPGTMPGTGEYPVPAVVTTSPEVDGHTYAFAPWDRGPAAPAAAIPVGDQVRHAFIRAVHLHLQPVQPGEVAQLSLELEALRSGIVRSGGLWQARIDVRVVVRWGDELLARLPVLGSSPVGVGSDAVPSAFMRAAWDAAHAFAVAFDTSAPIGAWLASRGLRQPGPPERPAVVPFLDLGAAAAVDGGGILVPLEVQAGLAGRHWFLQAVGSWRREVFPMVAMGGSPVGAYFDATADVTRIGLDAGVPLRLGASWEVRAGAGVHWLRTVLTVQGSQNTTTKSSFGGSVLAGGTWIGAKPMAGLRLRVGLEARLGLGTEVRSEALVTSYQVVTAALLTVGVEPSVTL